ncbi:MAG: hypothetical protein Q9170_002078 [Blastenia crenularia]
MTFAQVQIPRKRLANEPQWVNDPAYQQRNIVSRRNNNAAKKSSQASAPLTYSPQHERSSELRLNSSGKEEILRRIAYITLIPFPHPPNFPRSLLNSTDLKPNLNDNYTSTRATQTPIIITIIIMKFLATLLLALTATTALAMPAPEAEPAALEKRQSCKRKLRFRPDQNGICVDTRQANSCNGGAIYTGLCPGTPNYVLCCIQ